MAMTNINIRIDADKKLKAQELFSSLGLDMTTFFTMAAKQAVREQALPFKMLQTKRNTDYGDTHDAAP